MKKCLFSLIVCLLLSAAGTLAANSHWTVNPHNYQYDMTAYVKVVSTAGSPLPQDGYEVSAFCGEECRGVGKLLTASDGTQVFQLRIYSNATADETIVFRIYQKDTDAEFMPDSQLAFEPLAVAGTPSEPVLLTWGNVLLGDANGDGVVTIADVTAVINHINGITTGTFIEEAANVNHDETISIADVTGIINIINK